MESKGVILEVCVYFNRPFPLASFIKEYELDEQGAKCSKLKDGIRI